MLMGGNQSLETGKGFNAIYSKKTRLFIVIIRGNGGVKAGLNEV